MYVKKAVVALSAAPAQEQQQDRQQEQYGGLFLHKAGEALLAFLLNSAKK